VYPCSPSFRGYPKSEECSNSFGTGHRARAQGDDPSAPRREAASQHELVDRFGVARETIKAALRKLQDERLIVTQQGSGTYVRANTERPVGLRPHVERAFEATHVTIDFAGFS
jgi:DNA-binding transcriptional MocR family regulator